MNQLHLHYKKETGRQAIESYEGKMLSNDILRINSCWIPDEYMSEYCGETWLDLPTPEYVKWLEDQIKLKEE